MTDILYVHAYSNDVKIIPAIASFFIELKGASIEGLERLEPVIWKEKLDELIQNTPDEFKDAVNHYSFRGIGIWTEWSDKKYIDNFYRSHLHKKFSYYAQQKPDIALYRIVQLRGEHVSAVDVKVPQ